MGTPEICGCGPDGDSRQPARRGRAAAVLFYLYADDLAPLREDLLSKAISASEISFPFYMPKGEIRVVDPDGYVLLIGQVA